MLRLVSDEGLFSLNKEYHEEIHLEIRTKGKNVPPDSSFEGWQVPEDHSKRLMHPGFDLPQYRPSKEVSIFYRI